MGRLFLGKWWHWLLLLVMAGLFWQAGLIKLHVIEFNRFVLILLAGTVVALLALIYGTRPGEQITREALHEADEPTDPSSKAVPGPGNTQSSND